MVGTVIFTLRMEKFKDKELVHSHEVAELGFKLGSA